MPGRIARHYGDNVAYPGELNSIPRSALLTPYCYITASFSLRNLTDADSDTRKLKLPASASTLVKASAYAVTTSGGATCDVDIKVGTTSVFTTPIDLKADGGPLEGAITGGSVAVANTDVLSVVATQTGTGTMTNIYVLLTFKTLLG